MRSSALAKLAAGLAPVLICTNPSVTCFLLWLRGIGFRHESSRVFHQAFPSGVFSCTSDPVSTNVSKPPLSSRFYFGGPLNGRINDAGFPITRSSAEKMSEVRFESTHGAIHFRLVEADSNLHAGRTALDRLVSTMKVPLRTLRPTKKG